MKKIISTIVFMASTILTLNAAAATREIQIGLSGVYVPAGFDSSSDSYVVVNGVFPNGCYSWKRADIKEVTTFQHEVKSIASVTEGMCIMVLIPFQKDITLGKLATGKHSVKFLNGDGTYIEKSFVVE